MTTPATPHAGQYNITEDEMAIIGSCDCGWSTPPHPIAESFNLADRSAAMTAAALAAAADLTAHLNGYPCPPCAGTGTVPTKPWEPPIVCPICNGSKTCWPNKPEPTGRRHR